MAEKPHNACRDDLLKSLFYVRSIKSRLKGRTLSDSEADELIKIIETCRVKQIPVACGDTDTLCDPEVAR